MKSELVRIKQGPEKTSAEKNQRNCCEQEPYYRFSPADICGIDIFQFYFPCQHTQRLTAVCPLPGEIQAGDTKNINIKWQVAAGYGLTVREGQHD